MKKFEINEYIVKTDKFQKGFSGYNFVVISDLHSNAYKVDLEKVQCIALQASALGCDSTVFL